MKSACDHRAAVWRSRVVVVVVVVVLLYNIHVWFAITTIITLLYIPVGISALTFNETMFYNHRIRFMMPFIHPSTLCIKDEMERKMERKSWH